MASHNFVKALANQAGVKFQDLEKAAPELVQAGYDLRGWRENFGCFDGIRDGRYVDWGAFAWDNVTIAGEFLVSKGCAYNSQVASVLELIAEVKSFETELTHGKIEFPQWKRRRYQNMIGRIHVLAMMIAMTGGYRPPSQKQLDDLGDGGGR